MISFNFIFVYEIYEEQCLSKGISRILKMSEDDANLTWNSERQLKVK